MTAMTAKAAQTQNKATFYRKVEIKNKNFGYNNTK